MKKHSFNSLTDFYKSISNVINNPCFDEEQKEENISFRGLSNNDILKYKYTYPLGLDMLKNFQQVNFEKPVKVKYYNSFDGYDIDIDRMHDNLDFLIDHKRQKKQPKTINLFINLAESCRVSYTDMLNKMFAAVKIIDELENKNIRVAVYSCFSAILSNSSKLHFQVDICVKNYNQPLNLAAISTSISPWFFRYWVFLFIEGRYSSGRGIATPAKLTPEKDSIIIDNGDCLTMSKANQFINNLQL